MNMYPELVKRGIDFPGSKRCGDCHIDIYKEWADSMHAKSYVNEEFRVASNDYGYPFCMRCHVPESILTESNELMARDHNLEDGVDCQGCHLTSDCLLSGPHSGIGPHPLEENQPFYKDSRLCGTCHIDTYEEYLRYVDVDQKQTCQDCHMPAVRRKLIQDEPWQKIHRRKEGKAHTFSVLSAIENTEDFIELTFAEINKNNNHITGILEIVNTSVNHSIPTGSYGYREVLLLINLKDNLGRTIKSKHVSMFMELNTQLKPGEKKIYSFVFDLDDKSAELKELEAILFRTNFKRTNKILLAEIEFCIE
ncbi:MAG: cytochrome c family protein [Candidatus Scalindua sp.]|nr:cytochrome c family protein [Candidatus Scalindua sp.]